MGLFNRTTREEVPQPSTSSSDRNAIMDFLNRNRVSEATLQVWRQLPSEVRADPSMINFQREAERWKAEHSDVISISGRSVRSLNDEIEMDILHRASDDKENDDKNSDDEDKSLNRQFIEIKVTNPEGISREGSHLEFDGIRPRKVVLMADTPTLSENSHDHFNYPHPRASTPFHEFGKVFFLVCIWALMITFLASTNEKRIEKRQLVVPIVGPKLYDLPLKPTGSVVHISLQAPFLPDPMQYTRGRRGRNSTKDNRNKDNSLVIFMRTDSEKQLTLNKTFYVCKPEEIDKVNTSKVEFAFDMGETYFDEVQDTDTVQIVLVSNFSKSSEREKTEMPIIFSVDFSPVNKSLGVLFAAFVLILLYALIVWEVVHRTLAAIIASTLSIALLAALDDRPTHDEIMGWIDVETVLLLFAMMILVGILTETGVFDHLAVYAYRVTNGQVWPLIHCLCIITCLVSMLLDNVTTVLLMAPITITLCEDLDLNPVPILMAIVLHANIGGCATPIGDPPNMIITTNQTIMDQGINFLTFTIHMLFGVILVTLATNIHLRLMYPSINALFIHEPKDIKMLKKSIMTWERTLRNSISPISKDADMVRETLVKKVKSLRHELKHKMTHGAVDTKRYKSTLEEMEKAYPIKNRGLLIRAGISLIFILVLFFIQSIPEAKKLSLGWSALIGIIFLLIISGRDDMDAILHRVEWPTLLFFAAMFVLMEAVERMGFIAWIGSGCESIIKGVSKDYRLTVAIVIILWVSALTSAFVESLPVTQMMVKIVVSLVANTKLALPLQPLVWAIAFGPALGGNGTLVGASANVICAGIAEQHGYKMNFIDFLKFGFPIMLVSVLVTTGYLLFFHSFLAWH